MIWLAFSAVALADPPHSLDELQVVAERADTVIERCELLAADCEVGRLELGESFLARAAAAAVFVGTIDRQSAANARYLTPDVALGWEPLLPASDGVAPEPWLTAWVAGNAVRASEPLPAASAAPRTGSAGPGAASPAPTVAVPATTLRGQVLAWTQTGGSRTIELAIDVRQRVSKAGGLYAAGSFGWTDLDPEPFGAEKYRLVQGEVVLGGGPRWTWQNGGDGIVYLAVSIDSGAATFDTWRSFTDSGWELSPMHVGVGGGLGVAAHYPLVPAAGLDLGWEVLGQGVKRYRVADFWQARRRSSEPGDFETGDAGAGDLLALRTGLELRWRPGRGATTLSAGATLRAGRLLHQPPMYDTTWTSLGGSLGVGFRL